MKDIVITSRRQKKEIISFVVCFLVAFAANVYAIVKYDGKWSELFWSLGFVFTSALILYALWTLIRAIIFLVKKLIRK